MKFLFKPRFSLFELAGFIACAVIMATVAEHFSFTQGSLLFVIMLAIIELVQINYEEV